MGFAQAIKERFIGKEEPIIWRVDGDGPRGEHYWTIVAIDKPRFQAFRHALEHGKIRVQDFGRVLAWGQGENPPNTVVAELKKTYPIKDSVVFSE